MLWAPGKLEGRRLGSPRREVSLEVLGPRLLPRPMRARASASAGLRPPGVHGRTSRAPGLGPWPAWPEAGGEQGPRGGTVPLSASGAEVYGPARFVQGSFSNPSDLFLPICPGTAGRGPSLGSACDGLSERPPADNSWCPKEVFDVGDTGCP